MKPAVAALFVCVIALSCLSQERVAQQSPQTPPAQTPVQFIPVDQIHAGMKGVAYTVFQGTQPEPMDVEVLGVLRNSNGPKGDLILVRLKGTKPEYTGVVAGMSGSPVYIDGKLAGALSFRIGQYSKEPIAGVTPIADMLEINEMDRTVTDAGRASTRPRADTTRTAGAANITAD